MAAARLERGKVDDRVRFLRAFDDAGGAIPGGRNIAKDAKTV
jgi:hypothetical protein